MIGGGDRNGDGDGIDSEPLEQRREFLRPYSLVAIVMLTDENECSVRDEHGFIGTGSRRIRCRAAPVLSGDIDGRAGAQ